MYSAKHFTGPSASFTWGRNRDFPGKYFPLICIQLYLWLTFLLFWVGPFVSQTPNLFGLTVFVSGSHLLFMVGYLSRASKQYQTPNINGVSLFFAKHWESILWLSVSYVCASSIYRYVRYDAGTALFDNLANPGAAYHSRRAIGAAIFEGGNLYMTFDNFLFVLSSFAVPLSVIYWDRISKTQKAGLLVAITLYTLSFVGIGTNKGFADLTFQVIAGFAIRRHLRSSNGVGGRMIKKTIFCIIILLVLVVGYLSFNFASRQIARGHAGQQDMSQLSMGGEHGDGVLAEVLASVFEEKTAYGLYSLCWYASHSYAGLAYCLRLPFEWTWGAGNSMAAMGLLQQYLGVNGVWERTYLSRVENQFGWPGLGWWATMYPWFAGDITFPGVLLLMMALGWVIADVWVKAVLYADPFAATIFCWLAIQVGMIPANNQLGHARNSWFATLFLLILYVASGALRSRNHAGRLRGN